MKKNKYQVEHDYDAIAGELLRIYDHESGLALTAVPRYGFVCSSIQLEHPEKGKVELLYNGGRFPQGLSVGMCPILFPCVGRLLLGGRSGAYEWDRQVYEMDIHGFAKDLPWEILACEAHKGSAFVTGRLVDNPASRKAYPFTFCFELTYRVQKGVVLFESSIYSQGPYALGYHPYFKTPVDRDRGSKSDCAIRIPATKLWEDEDLVPTGRLLPIPETWPLADGMNLGGQDVDVAFTGMTTRRSGVYCCELMDRASGFQLLIEADRRFFPEVVLCTRSEAPYVCLENWTGPPNGFNTGWGLISPLTKLVSTIRIIPKWVDA